MDYIKVGKIFNSFGIKGEVKVKALTSDLNRFNFEGPYYLADDKKEVFLESYRPHKNFLIFKFKEFSNINEVLPFKDTFIYVAEDDIIDLPEDSYFYHDLIGLDVYHGDRYLGKIDTILEGPANDVYQVKGKDSEYLIPAVKEFILDVDLNKGSMQVKLIEGMQDEI